MLKKYGIYEEEKMLFSSHCDMFGRWKISDILISMQEIAGISAHYMGAGRETLIHHGIVWVISRGYVTMERYPNFLDTVKIKTYPKGPKGVFFPRFFTFEDVKTGETLGCASTSWLLFSLEHRRVLRPQNIPVSFETDESLQNILPPPEKIVTPQDMEHKTTRTVLFSECDINGHMNNSKYAEYVLDLLPIEYLEKKMPKELTINYNAEAMLGTQVEMYTAVDGNTFYAAGRTAGKNVFDTKLIL